MTCSTRPTSHPTPGIRPIGAALCVTFALIFAATGCGPRKTQETRLLGPYQNIGPRKNLPPYLKGSIYELVELSNHEPLNVSSYGLVGQLRGTGDTKAPPAVRQWMIKEMVRRGFGSRTLGYESISAGKVLASPDFAIVRVDAALPPGVRAGDRIDVLVSALQNDTSSLAGGVLFEAELRDDGANPQNPAGSLEVLARCGGPIAVNPAYVLEPTANPAGQARSSLRRGVIMDNCVVYHDRPLWLMLRQPQHSVARAIERRINDRFQQLADHPRKDGQPGNLVAAAYDEGIVQFFVPRAYNGDWQHFAGVVQHLYLNSSPAFAATKARELADEAIREAQKPDPRLMNISYAWEGLGSPALPVVSKLMSHEKPVVAFAAARAAAFIGDPSFAAQETLIRMAETAGHPFQLSAIQVLGKLPASSALSQLLRRLLNAPEATVRVEAYRVLAAAGDPAVFSRPVRRNDREKFVLDVVPGDGPPLIYATHQGRPRVAVIGRMPMVRRPVTFTALSRRLMISSVDPNAQANAGNGDLNADNADKPVPDAAPIAARAMPHAISIYFRDPRPRTRKPAVKVLSRPDVAELAARLGGEGAPGEPRLDFSYGEVVAILQTMSDKGDIVSNRRGPDGRLLAASFVLQEPAHVADEVRSAPSIDEGRPQADSPVGSVGMR